jgi:putative nucleotidyltransferase with HDIG domain
MNESLMVQSTIRERVQTIEHLPAIPTVFLPLLKLLSHSDDVKIDEVVRLVSYDNSIAAQCLRVAGSPLFGLAQAPHSIKSAVVSLGLRRVQTIVLTCCLGRAFPARSWVLDPEIFWRHSLGCAMMCRKFSETLLGFDHEKAYMAGLLHDIGFMVNCLVFPKEFAVAMEIACAKGIPLHQAEMAAMGFTHCDTGKALAERWHLSDDIAECIHRHHDVEHAVTARALTALVHLSDTLCRMRGLGYGYYELQKADLVADPAWAILLRENPALEGLDLARFTYEMDDAAGEIRAMVAVVFGGTASME